MAEEPTVLDHAKRLREAGLSVIPVKADGSKSPMLAGWRKYSIDLPIDALVESWFGGDTVVGIGVCPGPASGNLVVLDFECKNGKSAYHEWIEKLPPELVAWLAKCPMVKTPSGGRHVWVRLDSPQSGGRLARYANGTTKVEVRGEGHQVLAPGCPLSCHKSGEPYIFERFGWITTPCESIPADVWAAWLQYSTEINEWSAPDFSGSAPERQVGPVSDDAPGTDFNRRGTWEETGLFDAGWKWVRKPADDRGLICRPGKDEGVSASVGMVTSKENGWPLFYCWSTSVGEFVSEKPYSRFAVFAILKHKGDFQAAAKALAQSGYGHHMPQVPVRLSSVLPPPQPHPLAETEEQRHFRWMSELKFRPENDKWLWHGYLSRGGITLFSALWKAGKSTLLSHLVRAFDGRHSEFAGRGIVPCRVLYVSEEHEELWAERRDALGIQDHVGMVSRPFKGRPSPGDWTAFIAKLIESVKNYSFDVVIIDTLSKLWPVREENDAGQVEEALMPLWELTATGIALCLVHHSRKSDGNQFTGARGSGGLPAFCETLIEFRRDDETDDRNCCRVLTAAGRYRETPSKWKVELGPDGYVSHGDPNDGVRPVITTWRSVLDEIMPEDETGQTIIELQEALKTKRGEGVRKQELLSEINQRVEGGEYLRLGEGSKSSPYRYAKVAF